MLRIRNSIVDSTLHAASPFQAMFHHVIADRQALFRAAIILL